jgi:hypothetical protein
VERQYELTRFDDGNGLQRIQSRRRVLQPKRSDELAVKIARERSKEEIKPPLKILKKFHQLSLIQTAEENILSIKQPNYMISF